MGQQAAIVHVFQLANRAIAHSGVRISEAVDHLPAFGPVFQTGDPEVDLCHRLRVRLHPGLLPQKHEGRRIADPAEDAADLAAHPRMGRVAKKLQEGPNNPGGEAGVETHEGGIPNVDLGIGQSGDQGPARLFAPDRGEALDDQHTLVRGRGSGARREHRQGRGRQPAAGLHGVAAAGIELRLEKLGIHTGSLPIRGAATLAGGRHG